MIASPQAPQPRARQVAPETLSKKEQVLGAAEAAVLEDVLGVRAADPNAKPTSPQALLDQFGLS